MLISLFARKFGRALAARVSAMPTDGVLGSMMAGGTAGAGLGMGPPTITADNRLNVLFVQGTPGQIRLVETLLDVIDQETGPEEVLTSPKPKFHSRLLSKCRGC